MSKSGAVSEFRLARICTIRHDMELVNIKNIFPLECSMHSRASSMTRASAVKMEI